MGQNKQYYWQQDVAKECLIFKSRKVADSLSGIVTWLSIAVVAILADLYFYLKRFCRYITVPCVFLADVELQVCILMDDR